MVSLFVVVEAFWVQSPALSLFFFGQMIKMPPEGYQCIICDVLDANDDGEWSRLSCGHHYHTNCITALFEMLEMSGMKKYCTLCCEGDAV